MAYSWMKKQSATSLKMSGPFTSPSSYNYTTCEKSEVFTNTYSTLRADLMAFYQTVNIEILGRRQFSWTLIRDRIPMSKEINNGPITKTKVSH
jgi:hypothetical protein